MSLVSLEAEVIIDIHHIVRLTYDVTMDDNSNYPMVHVTAYGSLPHAVNSVITLMNYQLSVIQTSPVDTFLGATSIIHVGNQTLLFTLQGKAVWKAGETDLVPGEVKISKTTPQADQERRSSRTVSVQVTLESVQSPGMFVCVFSTIQPTLMLCCWQTSPMSVVCLVAIWHQAMENVRRETFQMSAISNRQGSAVDVAWLDTMKQ